MPSIASRVVHRFLTGFKYQPKETKQSKVDRLTKLLREKTGLSRSMAENIVDAVVRNREVERLAMQKSWPIEEGVITGPAGSLELQELQSAT